MILKKITFAAVLSASSVLALGLTANPIASAAATSTTPHSQGAKIQHMVYLIADNVHMEDIQKMPHLMQFLHKGTMFTNDHTVLDSHTQDGMLSDMTGQYPSKTGVPDQSFFANGIFAGFLYWTSTEADGQPHVTTTPPWDTFNQHGWNVGAVGAPDMELESKSEVKDMNTAVDSNPYDYLGVAVHNANGSHVLGSPNIPYIYNAPSWVDGSKMLAGFPGWGTGGADPTWSLQATYEMQTHGVPVTFTYLHDVHEVNGKQMPPGQYDSTIQMYDQAFAKFFTELDKAGIDQSNTLFVVTTDEGDHYVPGGEHNTNLQSWITNTSGTPADQMNIISDSGALVYLKDNALLPKTLAGFSGIPGWNYLADPTALKTLHVASDAAPARTPSFIVFSKPDVWYNTTGSTDWTAGPYYMYNHGTISDDILGTWLGMVGPGVNQAHTSAQWLDHTDTMPTIYALLGYNLAAAHFDGVPAIDAFVSSALPAAVRRAHGEYSRAEELYKQLNAPVGAFGMAALHLSTEASLNATNEQGPLLDKKLADATKVRDGVASALQTSILSGWSSAPSSSPLAQDSERAVQSLQTLGAAQQ